MILRMNVDRMERIMSQSIPENRNAFTTFVKDLSDADKFAASCNPEKAIMKIQDAIEKRRAILNRPYMTSSDAHEFALETLDALQDIAVIVQEQLRDNCSCRVNYSDRI